ncbi:ribonuclease R [Candidatus Stoquefichus massiliensis]|uniref:ribonuclease R n=1 Tax=Candidatus Stoquefichus massiliensis TaxID=1470350 RepID=UPI0004825691|nr:ribonuclease R [Candidatus Stoquefichus massiliensis]
MKEKILELLEDQTYTRRKINELAEYFHMTGTQDYIAFIKLMNELEDEGIIMRSKYNDYYLIEQLHFYSGTLEMNKKGFGFVRVSEDQEFYINESHMKDAFDKDTVLIEKIRSHGNKEEGRVVKVIKRGKMRYVGEVKRGKRDYFVKVDDAKFEKMILVDSAHMHGAMPGHKVVVEIKTFKPQLKGDIIKVIGHHNDPGVDILSIVHAHDVDIDFPEAVYDQVEKIADEIDPSDIVNRVDLRNEMIVTIDGDDAKDLDDAISLKKLKNGHYQLGVHIADVSFYVTESSPLDKEAIKRGTSIYLVDRVIPMLPHKLSNGICSLNPNVDRYTISCIMEIDKNGQVMSHEIIPSVIHSSYRMTYNNVNKILDGDKDLQREYGEVVPMFFLMQELADILRKQRFERGAIDFDVDEAKVLVDDKGKPTDVVLRTRGISDKIIEEFMLKANETVAQHFKWMELPFIYRVHEHPKLKKLQQFAAIVKPLGYTIKGSLDHVYPNELNAIIEASKGTEEHTVISTLLLRCMQKARYDRQCLGHFGLADEYYTHFTSPIRRYPDLLVHRCIRTFLFQHDIEKTAHFEEVIPELAEQSSFRERESIQIEREVDDMKMAEYMEGHIGEEFEGIISSITQFGFFVELPNTIDGLVHITDLTDDFYHYDEKNIMLVGERTGKTFKLSNKVKVKVIGANKKERTVDFELVGMKPRVKKPKTIHLNDKKVKTNRKKKGKINKPRSFARKKRR